MKAWFWWPSIIAATGASAQMQSSGAGQAAPSTGSGQAFPSKPVRFLVPFPPGGGADVIGRVIALKLVEKWGKQVVIDNRAGAGGNIAAELAAAAAPDGHTIFQFNIANAIAGSLYKKLNYDPIKDFSAVTLLASSPFILVTHPGVKASNVQELVALAKAQPGKLAYASSGNGGPSHLATELLKTMTQIGLIHVPYKGVALALNELLGGQIQIMFTVPATAMPHMKAGRLRGLAVSGAKRSPLAPELPTVAESGVAGYEAITWYAVVVPAGTPRAVIAKLHTDITQVLQQLEVRERLTGVGVELIGSTPDQLALFIKAEIAKWSRLVKFSEARID